MLRVALVDNDAAERKRLRDALLACFAQAHLANTDVVSYATVGELAAAYARLRHDFFDLAFCSLAGRGFGSKGRPAEIGLLQALHEAHPHLHLALASQSATDAQEAFNLGAAFLLLPGNAGDLARALHAQTQAFQSRRQTLLAVRTASTVDSVPLDDVQFVESTKRGPMIHLSERRTIVARGTLRALFDQLPISESGSVPRFVMAGSSFIVNLDNVRAAGKGALVFADGEAIIVPVRKRKDLETALQAWRTDGRVIDGKA